ncbi:hypothetical protein [Epilithonimonas caeni]|uniref:hypothetical protein n=1 Tax=Epilithonimonas caeni TaxID=365343 RepID=UPI000418CC8F|nr:hypothetical protein [Epilithonimonas caeni]
MAKRNLLPEQKAKAILSKVQTMKAYAKNMKSYAINLEHYAASLEAQIGDYLGGVGAAQDDQEAAIRKQNLIQKFHKNLIVKQ